MDLHEENCKKAPFNQVPMVSATDYAAALKLPGNFSWKRAMKTALVKSEMKMLLPLTDFMARPEGPVDPLAFLGGSKQAYSMMRDTLSPLHLYALGALAAPIFSVQLLCRPSLPSAGRAVPVRLSTNQGSWYVVGGVLGGGTCLQLTFCISSEHLDKRCDTCIRFASELLA